MQHIDLYDRLRIALNPFMAYIIVKWSIEQDDIVLKCADSYRGRIQLVLLSKSGNHKHYYSIDKVEADKAKNLSDVELINFLNSLKAQALNEWEKLKPE